MISSVHLPNGQTVAAKREGNLVHFILNPPQLSTFVSIPQITWCSFYGQCTNSLDHQSNPSRFPSRTQDHFYIATWHDNIIAPHNTPTNHPTPQFPSTQIRPYIPEVLITLAAWISMTWYFHLETPDLKNSLETGTPISNWELGVVGNGLFDNISYINAMERFGLVYPIPKHQNVSFQINQATFWNFNIWKLFYWLELYYHPTDPLKPLCDRREVYLNNTFSLSFPLPQLSLFNSYNTSVYTHSNNVLHPIRPSSPFPGQTIYIRYIPSLQQYISFRTIRPNNSSSPGDANLLLKWMNCDRVAKFWGVRGNLDAQKSFLRQKLSLPHSFSLIGYWDDKPFGYFEVYWVKEDLLGQRIGYDVDNYDRGFHCLVGEQEFRGAHRVKVWMTSLLHYCFQDDPRTQAVYMEPRIDNSTISKYCLDIGFANICPLNMGHKMANLMKYHRLAWSAPAL